MKSKGKTKKKGSIFQSIKGKIMIMGVFAIAVAIVIYCKYNQCFTVRESGK